MLTAGVYVFLAHNSFILSKRSNLQLIFIRYFMQDGHSNYLPPTPFVQPNLSRDDRCHLILTPGQPIWLYKLCPADRPQGPRYDRVHK